MENNLLSALTMIGDWYYLSLLFIGSFLGVVFGALPGLTAPMAIAVLLPLTYSMEAKIALGFLLGVYSGVGYGGAIPAILLNIPGTPSAVVTTIDGHAMARNGLAGKAIGVSIVASFVAGIFSIVCLMLAAPVLAGFALQFGPQEYFAAGLVGLSITSGVIGKSWAKGFWSAAGGVFLSTVGMDPITSDSRFTFGIAEIMSGIPFIPVMIGMYGFTKVLVYLNNSRKSISFCDQKVTGVIPSWHDMRHILKSTFQGAITGTVVGAIPGAGPAIAAFISYDIEKKTSPKLDVDGRAFGDGRMDGVAAPEAANNAITGGALIPLLTFGIPGSAAAAIMLGAFLMNNLTPGALFFTTHKDIVYSMYVSLIASNILILIVCLAGIRVFIKVLAIPIYYLMPVILLLCVVGSYCAQNNPAHIIIMLIFGIVGYVFERAAIPQLPLILGLILGPLIETNLRYTLILENGNLCNIIYRPICAVLLFFAVVILIGPISRSVYRYFTSNSSGELL